MYQDLKRTCRTIFLLSESFVWYVVVGVAVVVC